VEQRNPLQFFIDLADEKPNIIQQQTVSHDDWRSLDDDLEQGIGWKGGTDDLNADNSYWYSSYFDSNLSIKIFNEKTEAIDTIDNMLAGMTDLTGAFSKLTEFISTMNAVTNKLKANEGAMRHPEILRTCEQLNSQLHNRKTRIFKSVDTVDDMKPVTSNKLQWLGQVNVLGTLFYHLLRGQDGGDPYIAASVEQVKRMLMDNFVDSDGNELSKETLKTIFTISRSEKRAKEGDRIELPNKRLKI